MDQNRRKVIELNIEDVLPNRFQPRIKFSEEAINELSKSIKEHGVIQPIVVRPIGDKFEIIAGERRYKASCMAGLKTIPALITDLNDKDSAEVALIENVQRENLTPIEEAISYRKILDMGYITQDALATKLGKTQSTIANKLRLLNLDDEVQEALLKERISERHARSLLKLTDKEQQKMMLNRIISERLPVRRADEEIDKLLNGEKITDNFIQEESNSIIKINPIENENNIDIIDEVSNERLNQEFKFINMQNQEFVNNEENQENQELKPSKFFNILNEEEKEEAKEEKEPVDFNNIFINPFITDNKTEVPSNNRLLEELAEIENSINNSNKVIEKEINKEQKEEQINESIEIDDDLEFIEEDEFEESEKELEKEIQNEEKHEEALTIIEPKINNFKDVLQSIRNCSNKIEESGFVIDTEEYDLEGMYQVVFKITKD